MKTYIAPSRPETDSLSFTSVVVCIVGLAMIVAGLYWLLLQPAAPVAEQAAEAPLPSATVRGKRPRKAASAPPTAALPTPAPPVEVVEPPVLVQAKPAADMRLVTPAAAVTPVPVTEAPKRTGFVWNGGNLRQGPGLQHPVVAGVDAGDVVELVRSEAAWWLVKTLDGEGWISATLLIIDGEITPPLAAPAAPAAPAPPAAAPAPPLLPAAPAAPVSPPPAKRPDTAASAPADITAQVRRRGNVRAGPGTNHGVMAQANAGVAVKLVDAARSGGATWWRVQVGATTGWMSGSLLRVPPEAARRWPAAKQDYAAASKPAPAEQPAAKPAAKQPAAAPETAKNPSWRVDSVPGRLTRLPSVAAPHPFLAPAIVQPYLRARARVLQASGIDYLGRLDEAFRTLDFRTSKPGVARHSWHNAGRAIDLQQGRGVIFVRDAAARSLYRALLRCARQDGAQCAYYGPKQLPRAPGYYLDVTAILTSEGFQRIPPVGGVSEAWHYELRGGLTWAGAMTQIHSVRTLRRWYPEIWR